MDIPKPPLHSSLHDSQVLDTQRKVRQVLQATKAIENTFVPVNRLPLEILSNVLEHRASNADLVTATHVCQHWRSTLTSTPSLWTNLQFREPGHDIDLRGASHNADRALMYLGRAKSAPIDIEMDLDVPQHLEVSECLAPHIARIRSLSLDGGPEFIYATTLLLCNPAPSLQCLEIRCYESHTHLPENFLGRHALSLRHIQLCGVHPTFESPFQLPNLTRFNLRLLDDAAPFPMSTLFRFLSGSLRLEWICINSSTEALQDDALDEVISLESLVKLDYICSPAGQVLPYLRLPRLRRLYVCFTLGSGQVQSLADLLPYDGHWLLEGATKMEYHYPNSNPQSLAFHGENLDVTLEACLARENPIPVNWFSDPSYIPFKRIRSVVVGCSPNNATFPIAALENLEVLEVFPWDGPFTEAFFPSLHPGTDIPCRSLEVIHYANLEPLGPLVSLAKARLQAGHRLALVRFPFSSDRESMAELKELVGKVSVD